MSIHVLVLACGFNTNGNEVCQESKVRFVTVDDLVRQAIVYITAEGQIGKRFLSQVMSEEVSIRGWRFVERIHRGEEGIHTNTDYEIRMFAKQLKQIGAKGRVVIASSWYHMPRIWMLQKMAWHHAELDLPVEFRCSWRYGWRPVVWVHELGSIAQSLWCWRRRGTFNTHPTDPLKKQRPRA